MRAVNDPSARLHLLASIVMPPERLTIPVEAAFLLGVHITLTFLDTFQENGHDIRQAMTEEFQRLGGPRSDNDIAKAFDLCFSDDATVQQQIAKLIEKYESSHRKVQ